LYTTPLKHIEPPAPLKGGSVFFLLHVFWKKLDIILPTYLSPFQGVWGSGFGVKHQYCG